MKKGTFERKIEEANKRIEGLGRGGSALSAQEQPSSRQPVILLTSSLLWQPDRSPSLEETTLDALLAFQQNVMTTQLKNLSFEVKRAKCFFKPHRDRKSWRR